ncbi:hypothetical protein [Priestia megaterium]|uniref:hypothetical protein n=1 Tax=Priestia megaterium TaxID=1404 RepID=UPI00387A4318
MNKIIEERLEEFVVKFIDGFTETKTHLDKTNIKLSNSLPEVLTSKNLFVHATYSDSKQHILIRFNKGNKFYFKAQKVEGDVSNIFDPHRDWGNGPCGIKLSNSNATLNNSSFRGGRPFVVEGDDVELFLNNVSIETPGYGELIIDYGFVISYSKFDELAKNPYSFVNELTGVYLQFNNQQSDKNEYLNNLNRIKTEMENLFFDETIGELKIDSFIEENPIILEACLRLDVEILFFQEKLENIHEINPKNFRPDLIAYSHDDFIWKIIDYKRAKRSIINKAGKERTHFKAEIASLEGQLDDYVRYFSDYKQRTHFYEKHKVLIENPVAVGIIGNVSTEEVPDFNKLKSRLPNWLEIIPYNYLYNRFCRFIELTNRAV